MRANCISRWSSRSPNSSILERVAAGIALRAFCCLHEWRARPPAAHPPFGARRERRELPPPKAHAAARALPCTPPGVDEEARAPVLAWSGKAGGVAKGACLRGLSLLLLLR